MNLHPPSTPPPEKFSPTLKLILLGAAVLVIVVVCVLMFSSCCASDPYGKQPVSGDAPQRWTADEGYNYGYGHRPQPYYHQPSYQRHPYRY